MRIQPASVRPVASAAATPSTAAPVGEKPVAKTADAFTRAPREPVALAMPPPPATTQAADSLWYRTKKHVVLTFTGVNYDPHASKLDAAAVQKLGQVLQPGDVILRRTDGTTSNWFIPGYWGHAALYAGNGTIVDATTHDVRRIGLEDFCKEGDAVIVVRPKGAQPEQIAKAIDYAQEQVGKPYDFDLDFEDEGRFTCTELVETALKSATGRGWAEKNPLGSISPKDFLNDRFQFVWSNLSAPTK
ncbi:MAG: YiiX/YebB-like N1pC/P60 family cysteine hydrolase [Myxococcales bacterium]